MTVVLPDWWAVSKLSDLKEALAAEYGKTVTWIIAFAGVCILVGLDKLKPETVEYMLFALGGALAQGTKKKDPPPDQG